MYERHVSGGVGGWRANEQKSVLNGSFSGGEPTALIKSIAPGTGRVLLTLNGLNGKD